MFLSTCEIHFIMFLYGCLNSTIELWLIFPMAAVCEVDKGVAVAALLFVGFVVLKYNELDVMKSDIGKRGGSLDAFVGLSSY